MRNIFLLISILGCFSIQAKEVLVQGNIEGFDGKILKLALMEDYITSTKEYIGETVIEEGKFSLKIELSQSQQIFLKVEDKQSSFFAEPGGVYNLIVSYDEQKNRGQAYNKVLDLSIAFPQKGELNQLIKTFNQAYQEFFAQNYQDFIVRRASDKVEEFIQTQSEEASYQSNPFVKNYVKYALANLKDISHTSDDKLFKQYIQGQPILYHHKEYLNFFMQFYQTRFEQFCITKQGAELLKAIMFDKDLEKSLTLIQTEENFDQKALTELYFIYGLYEVYHKNTVEPESNLAMLNQLATKASTEENRKIARLVLEKLQKFGKSQNAPEFELNDRKNKAVTLSDFKGKPVYLGFWASWSIPSLKEMVLLQKLEEKYGDQIHFISINLDEDPAQMTEYLKERDFDWTFLHYGNDYDIREKYDVRAVPSYYLIDADGKLLKTYAPPPSEVERTFYNLLKK